MKIEKRNFKISYKQLKIENVDLPLFVHGQRFSWFHLQLALRLYSWTGNQRNTLCHKFVKEIQSYQPHILCFR